MAENHDPLEFVRVSDLDTGHRRSVRRIELPHGNYKVLEEEPALGPDDQPLAPEHNVDAPAPTGHAASTIPELKAEIARRNEPRAEDDHIVVGGRGNKPDLVAALEADDEAQAAVTAANPPPAGPPADDGSSVDPNPGHEANDEEEQD